MAVVRVLALLASPAPQRPRPAHEVPRKWEHNRGLGRPGRRPARVTFKYLKPGDAPEATFCKPSENATVYEYCNLHGLWKAEYTA